MYCGHYSSCEPVERFDISSDLYVLILYAEINSARSIYLGFGAEQWIASGSLVTVQLDWCLMLRNSGCDLVAGQWLNSLVTAQLDRYLVL